MSGTDAMTSQEQDLLTRVARAIWEAPDPTENGAPIGGALMVAAHGSSPQEDLELAFEVAKAAARAAIEAMVEPTKPMVFFGMDAMSRDDLEPTEDEFRDGFRAAIKAGLGQTFPHLRASLSKGEE